MAVTIVTSKVVFVIAVSFLPKHAFILCHRFYYGDNLRLETIVYAKPTQYSCLIHFCLTS